MFTIRLALFVVLLSLTTPIFAQDAKPTTNVRPTGKRPLILIPGITGSELTNSETGKKAWFTIGLSRDETDDLRLPISPDLRANTDKLVATDIIRQVRLPAFLPPLQVYNGVIEALKKNGYTEATWDDPKDADCFYVFAYDWRRDNVETAQNLMAKIAAAKAKLNRPDLKFDILAHSMGGLVARYAALYGAADLPVGNRAFVPTNAGARDINRLLLFGAPNAGSFSAFAAEINGYTVAGRRLPFVKDLTNEDVFSIPALLQVMPFGASAKFLDENLRPIKVDLYNAATWKKYGWGAINDTDFLRRLKDADQIPGVTPIKNPKIKSIDDQLLADTTYAQAQSYFAAALDRARRFHQALETPTSANAVPILTQVYGSNCKDTLAAVVIVLDKNNDWRTLTAPGDVKTASGRKLSGKELRAAMFAPGDSRVTQSSLLTILASNKQTRRNRRPTAATTPFFFCERHDLLMNNETIQTNFLSLLSSEDAKAAQSKKRPRAR